MKFMSFNTQHCLNYIERKIDFDVMARAILECGADVVGLNEMRNEGPGEEYTDQVKALSDLTGLKYYYFAKAYDFAEGPYGNGILSRYPIDEVETVLIPDPIVKTGTRWYETRCVLKAKIRGVTVMVTHYGLNPDEKENATKTVLSLIPEQKGVLMGDFNLEPNEELLLPIREVMIDTAIAFSEEKRSFPSTEPTRKIDYIFVTRDAKIVYADIPAIIASDHRPYVAELEF